MEVGGWAPAQVVPQARGREQTLHTETDRMKDKVSERERSRAGGRKEAESLASRSLLVPAALPQASWQACLILAQALYSPTPFPSHKAALGLGKAPSLRVSSHNSLSGRPTPFLPGKSWGGRSWLDCFFGLPPTFPLSFLPTYLTLGVPLPLPLPSGLVPALPFVWGTRAPFFLLAWF